MKNMIFEKYKHYKLLGHGVFAVTLSTYIRSEAFAFSDRMSHMWDQHFLRRVRRRLPETTSIDHDWIVEKSPEGFFHYHGFLAVPSQYVGRIWQSGRLHKQLNLDLLTFRRAGRYRPFRINSFLIEPVHSVRAWNDYIHKGDFPMTTKYTGTANVNANRRENE